MSRLLRTFKAAMLCQPVINSPNPPLQLPGATQAAVWPFLQLQQVPEALAASFYGRSRLPLCQPAKLPITLPCSSQAPLRPRQTFPAAPTSPWGPGSVLLRTFKAADVASPHKLAKPSPAAPMAPLRPLADLSCYFANKSLRPWQCPFKDVQGCSKPSPAASQARLRPRQTFPAAPRSLLRERGSVTF